MKIDRNKAVIGTALFLAGPYFLQVARAQTAPTPSSVPADARSSNGDEAADIIVQARRRDERLQDVPAVVNAVTSDQLQRLNFRNFTEVADVVPGLQLTNNANGIGGNAQLRGIQFDVNSGAQPTVEFYFNDALISGGAILQQMYDVGQIEVQRGPQGTLRGRSSPSGSITVTSHRPDLNHFGGYANVTGNDIGTQNLQGAVNVPVVPGIFALRAAGVVNQDNSNRVRTIDRSQDGRDPYSQTVSGRLSAVFTPTDFLRFEGTYQTIDTHSRSWEQVESFSLANPAAPTSPILLRARDRRSDNASPRYVDQTFNIYNGRAELAVAGQQLIYQFQHYTTDVESRAESDFANIFPDANTYQVNNIHNAPSESHEVRLQSQERLFDSLDYVVGFFKNTGRTPTDLTTPTVVRLPTAFGGGVATIVNTPISVRSYNSEKSYFGNLTAHIGSSNQISGGVRFIQSINNQALTVNGSTAVDTHDDDHAIIYTASAQHYFNPDIMVYAATGSSFRPGVTAVGDFNLAYSARERSFVTLPAERSTSYELGLRAQLFDKRLRFNVTGYHQKFKNFPYRQPGNGVYYVNTVASPGNPSGVAQQVGQFNFVAAVPVEVNGVEGELSFDLSRNLNVGIIASYSMGKVKNGLIACNDLNGDGRPDSITSAPTLSSVQAAYGTNNVGQCQVSQRSALQAPFSASVQAEYRRPVTRAIEGYLRGLFSFQGNSQGDPGYAYDDVRRYGLLNLYAGLRASDGMWEISFFAKNLFDQDRVLTRSLPLSTSYQQLTPTFSTVGANTTSTYTTITTTNPREVGINLRFHLGSR